MKYNLYAVIGGALLVTGVASFLAGKYVSRIQAKPADVTVTLTGDAAGAVTKDLNPPQALLYCGHDVIWAISNRTGKTVTVDLTGFRDKATKIAKDPIDFPTKSITIPPGEMRLIKGKVKDKNMFQVEPKGTQDAFGEYQDFVYSVAVDGQVLDPEVRVRK